MSNAPLRPAVGSLLCQKGLARRQGLANFICPPPADATDDAGLGDSHVDLLLRHDDGIVRDAFNARFGELNPFNDASKAVEIAKRESMLGLVYRLYRAGRNQTPVELRRELLATEVEEVISSVQRLYLMGKADADTLAAFCEIQAMRDEELLSHVMDPLQLRYLLVFHRDETREELRNYDVNTLVAACSRRDVSEVKAWFQRLKGGANSLPSDTPQFLRSVLLELWRSGQAELGGLAFEIAVLDTQLFQDLGWESTRAFCSKLRRVTGPNCEPLDAYLTDEDADAALLIAEALRQDDLIVHFRKLASTYAPGMHRDLRRRVKAAADQTREPIAEPVSRAVTSRTPASSSYRSFAISASAN